MVSSLMNSVVACFLSSVVMCLGWILAKRAVKDREQMSAFECGFDPIKSARSPFSLRFFLLAIIFLIFDVEIVLLFPVLSSIGFSFDLMANLGIYIFLLVLVVGLFYEWKEGSLDWAQ
ncbi:NADH dehydrogenase subunit 3 (mitochondrion) [Pomacea canaliculata]|uniref:NADH-ubiquinone oxidoreductase chain 3 n=1 Tax=Pomacea canaliculata TaxID=400727 RepID=A0A068FNT0_POMCA|nr:NADH dehydrogenase subunit 3 [Pomacea canaliculata]AID68208.1 NADH dehydrogenase subunit 3 [Pomacea canaliculata]AOY42378.1 NADH dehydrogenase subunit 3 [Pomacea canaliculata]ART65977.1 NADH dehydrogenase subunit 3 [Pomacea canaliculata]